MPLRLITRLRLWRRPAVRLVMGLMVAQAFLAGLAGAQAGVFGLSVPGEFAVICHGHGEAGSDPGGAPGPSPDRHPCCVACTAGAPPAVLPVPAIVLRAEATRPRGARVRHAVTIPIAARAVRAGPSQAPPSLA